jgi:hypothetical protein
VKRWAALVVLLALTIGVGEVQATHSEAHTVLERGLNDLERAASATGPERAALIQAVVQAVHSESSIGIRDWLLAPLEAPAPDVAQGRDRFDAALDVIGGGFEPGSSDDHSPRRQALDSVLAGPPFQTRDLKSISPEWIIPLIVLLEWLSTLIDNVIRWPFDRLGEAIRAFMDSPVYGVLITLMAIAAVAALILLYRGGLRAALLSETELGAAIAPLPPTSTEALERAQRLASDGRFRDASHFILLSALIWIEEHGQIRFERSATNWEHLQRLERHSPAAAPLQSLINRFDRVWYGQADTSAEDYRDLEELALRVRKAAV